MSIAIRNHSLTGAVLVVGSAQSGCQIAEELYLSGRKVYLCVGSAGRVPRRYRGKDIYEWMLLIGLLDRTVDKLPSPAARFAGNPHVSGKDGGRTLNLHQFFRDGVILLGHIQNGRGNTIQLSNDLKENLAKADKFETDLVKQIDEYIEKNGLKIPPEKLPELRDGYNAEEITELDLNAAGITTIIWAMGYDFDFSLIKMPITDGFGYPIQKRGVTDYPGLFFVGLPWLYKYKSGHLLGIGEDADYIASMIAARQVLIIRSSTPPQYGLGNKVRSRERTKAEHKYCREMFFLGDYFPNGNEKIQTLNKIYASIYQML